MHFAFHYYMVSSDLYRTVVYSRDIFPFVSGSGAYRQDTALDAASGEVVEDDVVGSRQNTVVVDSASRASAIARIGR